MNHTLIFGHKMPDTDSVCSAIALSNLKNKLGENTKPYILGKTNKETEFVLNYFNVQAPEEIRNVNIQIKDLNYDKIEPFKTHQSVHYAYNYMNKNGVRTLPIADNKGKLSGIITMKDIAMSLINTDQKLLCTYYDNIIETLDGSPIVKCDDIIDGEITVAAFEEKTLRSENLFSTNSIVIVGDRYDIVQYSIEKRVKLIIITGGLSIPATLVENAAQNNVNIISTPFKTYYTTKNIALSKYVMDIMNSKTLTCFKEDDYLDDCKEDIENSRHSKFPIVDSKGIYLGVLSRNHLINPSKKKVILVDHNEYGQSAEGLQDTEILEIIDHHKIGDIKTSTPILFRNSPVGSTNTIIYQMYREHNIEIDKTIAGIMISGIISDTLLLKSPTSTTYDRRAINDLIKILNLDINSYAMAMFKAGTSLEGKTVEEIFYQDFKNFTIEYKRIGISQIFTLNIHDITDKKQEYLDLINQITQDKEYYFIMMMVTDILDEGSYIFFSDGKEKLIRYTFCNIDIKQGMYIQDYVSRKKQAVPELIDAIHQMNQS